MSEAVRVDTAMPHPTASNRVTIMGMALDLLTHSEMVDRVFSDLHNGIGGWVVTPNVDIMRQCAHDSELQDLVDSATLKIIDGAPVEWAGKLAGLPMVERVPGAAMPWLLAPEAARCGHTLLLVGGREGAAEQGAEVLQRSIPGLRVGHHFPPFGFEAKPVEWIALRRAIAATQARIVFVGLGFPKQERVIRQLRSEFPDVWFIGCGAAIDFMAGAVPRAPEWMQRAGLEWSYRAIVEPRRLARRYFVHDLPFAARMMARAAAQRWWPQEEANLVA